MRFPRNFDPFTWELRISRTVDAAIGSTIRRSWKEDLITDRILVGLHQHPRNIEIAFPWFKSSIKIRWDAFKLSGPVETDRGDIAIVVARQFDDGTVLEGVAFLEAKRLYAATSAFDGIRNWEQLERMRILAPHHQVLLYDTTRHYAEGESFGNHIWFWGPRRLAPLSTRAIVVPTNYVLATKSRHRDLYRQGNALTHQICRRYLSGFDLEYDQRSLSEAKGFLDGIGGPQYLVIFTVQMTPEASIVPVDFNDKKYRRIGLGEQA